MVLTIGDMGKASILFYDKNTKPIYPPLLNEFSEETIYRAFIVYCKFNSKIAIDPELQAVCLEKPEDFNVSESIDKKIEKLKLSGKRYGQRELQDLLLIVNRKNIVNIKLSYKAVSELEKLRELINYSEQSDSIAFPSKFRELLLDYIDRYDIVKPNIETANPLIDYLDVFPNIITNKVDPCSNGCKIPKHWNLSDFHNNDLITIINKYYEHFRVLSGDDDIVKHILQRVQEDNKEIYEYAILTKYYAPIHNEKSSVTSIFTSDLTIQLFKYYFYSTLLNFTGLVEGDQMAEKVGSDAPPEMFGILGDAEPVDPTREEAFIKDQEEEGQIMSVKAKSAKIIFVLSKTIINSKVVIDYNYESLKEKVNKSKEQEKTDITDYLRDMTEEEREIENIFKTNKLETWSKGNQKGFRTYQGSTYDQEREIMEKQAIMEKTVGKKHYVTELNKDIYMLEEMERQAVSDEIDQEVNDLSMLANDDDYGDADGDEYY